MNDYVPQSRIVRDNRTKKTYSAISFTTMQLPAFNEFRDVFYKLNIKQIPDNISELLTPRGLALWTFKKKILWNYGRKGTIKFIYYHLY